MRNILIFGIFLLVSNIANAYTFQSKNPLDTRNAIVQTVLANNTYAQTTAIDIYVQLTDSKNLLLVYSISLHGLNSTAVGGSIATSSQSLVYDQATGKVKINFSKMSDPSVGSLKVVQPNVGDQLLVDVYAGGSYLGAVGSIKLGKAGTVLQNYNSTLTSYDGTMLKKLFPVAVTPKAGNNQTGTAGTALPIKLKVFVGTGATAAPTGTTVTFSAPGSTPGVTFGTATTATTAADGYATLASTLTLTATPGTYDIYADATGFARGLFKVTATADSTPPTVTAPTSISVNATSVAGTAKTVAAITAFLAGATATDDVAVTVNPYAINPLAVFPIGTTQVDFYAYDAAGNVGKKTAAITVADSAGPTITPPTGITITPTSLAAIPVTNSAIITFLNNYSAVDNVDAKVTVTNNLTVTTIPVGSKKTVIFSATDAAGNTGTATATITIKPYFALSPATTQYVQVGKTLAFTTTGSTKAAAWTVDAYGTLKSTTGISNTFTAGSVAGIATLTVKEGAGKSATVSVHVVSALALKNAKGTAITGTRQMVKSGRPFVFTPSGATGTFTATCSGPVACSAVLNNGKFTFTAPKSGAFAGDYTITINGGLTSDLVLFVAPTFVNDPKNNLLAKTGATSTVNIYGLATAPTLTVVDSKGVVDTYGNIGALAAVGGVSGHFNAVFTPYASLNKVTPYFVSALTDLYTSNATADPKKATQKSQQMNVIPVVKYTGQVIDSYGNAKANARVNVLYSTATLAADRYSISNNTGQFTFNLPKKAKGDYTFSVLGTTFTGAQVLAGGNAYQVTAGTKQSGLDKLAAIMQKVNVLVAQANKTINGNTAFVFQQAGLAVNVDDSNIQTDSKGFTFGMAILATSMPAKHGATITKNVYSTVDPVNPNAVIVEYNITDNVYGAVSTFADYLYITKSYDTTLVQPGDFISGAYRIPFAVDTYAMLNGTGVSYIPVADIMNQDAVNGTVTFRTLHLTAFGSATTVAATPATVAGGSGSSCIAPTSSLNQLLVFGGILLLLGLMMRRRRSS